MKTKTKTKMKMRFWQKTYLFTLALFLVCLNIGILSLTVYTYQNHVDAAESTATAEQNYVAMSFERDLDTLTSGSSFASPSLLMQSYGNYYNKKGISLKFEQGDKVVYTNIACEISASTNTISHKDIDDKRHIVIASEICDGKYVMTFAKNVEPLDVEFRSLMLTYTLTAIGVSLLLAICLYFILKRLSDPLERLRKTTEMIESGDFSVRANESGSDEFTLLAKSFNAMLEKINEQMATLEKEAARKQMLVDNMAHELRTPLTSIHGYAEFLEKANTTSERRAVAAKYIMSESERLQKISEILLDGAFIRENVIEKENVDLGNILRDVSEKLSVRACDAGVTITCDAASVMTEGNETLLSMLFYNLVENAIKACESGGEVKLSCCGGVAIIEDNGKGMSAEQITHITEPFYRTDRSRSRAEGGAGLGLSLCDRIVKTHGAVMRFESEVGVGTKIFVDFTSPKQVDDKSIKSSL